MIHKLRNMLDKLSIINLTLLKFMISIFSFIIIFLVMFGRNYWEKESLKLKSDLLVNSLEVQSKIQSNINTIEDEKRKNILTINQKKLALINIIKPIIDDTNIIVGYYDVDSGIWIKNVKFSKKANDEFLNHTVMNYEYPLYYDNEIVLKIPIYFNNQVVGYVWSYSESNNIVFNSYYELNGLLVLILALSSLIIIISRRNFKQIQVHLEGFCRMIIDTESYGQVKILNCKLPELNPILGKLSFFTDNLKRINRELESSKLKLTKIMEGISDGFFVIDRKFTFTFVNPETQKIYQDKVILGECIWEVFPEIIGALTEKKLHEAMNKEEAIYWEAESFTSPDQFYEYHAYPFEDGLTVFFRNITAQKKQQQEFARLERLNLIGQLAAGISHEIRNPLTTVKGFLQIFSSKPSFEREKVNLELMISEIDRANEIITGFLSLAKVNPDNIRLQNLNEIIHKVFPMLQADAFNNNKEVIVELNEMPDILVNENEIKQLILNLVRNGLEVTPENGRVIIGTALKGNNVVLTVKDQGPGIPAEIQAKIGTPFFTTKETGTGLGLAISIGIIQRHKAIFEFETGDNGTIFSVFFLTQI